MNSYEARARRFAGAYIAEIRRVHRAEWERVTEKGKVRFYNSSIEALCVARGAIVSIINHDMRAWGDRPSMKASSRAERAFNSIRSKGREVKVERKKRHRPLCQQEVKA